MVIFHIYIYTFRFLDFESIGSQQCILCLLIRPTMSSLFRADVSYKNPKFKSLVLNPNPNPNPITLTIMLYFRNNG